MSRDVDRNMYQQICYHERVTFKSYFVCFKKKSFYVQKYRRQVNFIVENKSRGVTVCAKRLPKQYQKMGRMKKAFSVRCGKSDFIP